MSPADTAGEAAKLRAVLEEHRWNRARAAQALGMSRTTLWRRMRELGMPQHLYQPGLLFLPFGTRDEAAMQCPRERTLGRGVQWIVQQLHSVDTASRLVHLDDAALRYDLLVIATGARLRFDMTPGVDEGRAKGNVHDFYTLAGAEA